MARERRGSRQKTFAVFGLGSFGAEVCRVLAEKGARVLAFDHHPEPLEKIRETVKQVSLLDSADEDAILAAPLDGVDVAIVAIGGGVAESLLSHAPPQHTARPPPPRPRPKSGKIFCSPPPAPLAPLALRGQ